MVKVCLLWESVDISFEVVFFCRIGLLQMKQRVSMPGMTRTEQGHAHRFGPDRSVWSISITWHIVVLINSCQSLGKHLCFSPSPSPQAISCQVGLLGLFILCSDSSVHSPSKFLLSFPAQAPLDYPPCLSQKLLCLLFIFQLEPAS